jgi:EpsI family protein
VTGRLVILTVGLFSAFVLLTRASRIEAVPVRAALATFPLNLAGWKGDATIPLDPAILNVLRVDDYLNRMYVRHDTAVGFYVGYYGSQRQGDTIHSPLNCLPGAGWRPVKQERVRIEVPLTVDGTESRSIYVNRLTIEKGLERDVVLYWYQFHGRVVASEYSSRALMVFDALRRNRTDGALVRIIAPVRTPDPSEELAGFNAAVAFARAVFPLLSRYLPA